MNPFELVRQSLWNLCQFGPSRAAPERIEALQERRFRRLLKFAADRSPFYREKYRGIDLDRCDVAELPSTNKAELMANFDRVVTDPDVTRAGLEEFIDDPENVGRFFLGKYPVCHTSGSQGQPMLVVQDRLVIDLLFAFQMTRGNVDYGPWHAEAVRRFFTPGRIAAIISKPGFYPSAWVWRHLPATLKPFAKLLYLQSNDPDLIGKLNEFRPTVLTATPTTMDMLAGKAGQLRLDALRQVSVWSEILTDAARDRIAVAFRVPVMDTYGSGECIFLTSGCGTGPGAHVNADWAILEAVDEAGRRVPDGELGQKAYVTNLANSVLPLIRYEVGDRLEMTTRPCGCGNRLPRVARILGRTGELFWVRSEAGHRSLSVYPFQHAFEFLRGVREWQVQQLERNRFRVRFEMLPGEVFDANKARRHLAERLAMSGFGRELDVQFEAVPRLEPDARTGKFRRVVSLGPPPERQGAAEYRDVSVIARPQPATI